MENSAQYAKNADKQKYLKIHSGARQAVMSVWPSGDISIGYVQRESDRKDKGEIVYHVDSVTGEKIRLTNATDEELQSIFDFADKLMAEGRTGEAFHMLEHLNRLHETATGLSDAIKSHKIAPETLKASSGKGKAIRGSNGITSLGKKTLKSAAALIHERWDKTLLTFATCTVPGLGEEDMMQVCASWPEITRRFQQELRRELRRKRLPLDYFGCSEIQPERFKDKGEIAPHLHFVFVGRRARQQSWQIDHVWLKETWERILNSFVDEPIYADAATEARGVRGDVKKEVGKYLSKGDALIGQIRDAGRASELPRAYWSVPFALRREIKSLVYRVQGNRAHAWADGFKALNDIGLTSLREVFVELPSGGGGPPREFCAGHTGWMKVDVLDDLRSGEFGFWSWVAEWVS